MSPIRIFKSWLGVLIAFIAGLGCGPIYAQVITTFDFDFSYVSSITPGANYGTLVGSFTATGSAASYVISSMSGTLNGDSVTLLAPGAFGGNDNKLKYSTKSKKTPYFDVSGVSFVANGIQLNLYYTGKGGSPKNSYIVTSTGTLGSGAVYTGTVTKVGAPGPVPGAGLWSFGGLFFGGVATRFRLCAAIGARAWREAIARFKRRRGEGEARA